MALVLRERERKKERIRESIHSLQPMAVATCYNPVPLAFIYLPEQFNLYFTRNHEHPRVHAHSPEVARPAEILD